MKWIKYIGALLVMACSPSLVTDIAYETGEDIECGYNVGEKLCDITLMDQDGNDWNLYENIGKVTVVDLSCGVLRVKRQPGQQKMLLILMGTTRYNG